MASLFITSAFRELIPSTEDPPKSVLNLCSSLYSSSKLSIPLAPAFEVARVHLCVYTVIRRYQDQYQWQDPVASKIPVPKSKVRTLIAQFASLVSPSTPREHNRVVNMLATPQTGSVRRNKTPFTSASLVTKSVTSVKRSLTDQLVLESSLSGTNVVPDSFLYTPESSPVKKRRGRPPKSHLQDLSPSTPSTPRKTKKLLTTPELVSFCNNFYIPSHLTLRILHMYQRYKATVSSTWGLLVGLVGTIYYKLNTTEIISRLGLWKSVISNLHRSQNGGLSYAEVEDWIKKVQNLYGDVKWIKEAEYEGHTTTNDPTEGIEVFASLGSFNDKLDYLSPKATQNWQEWCDKLSTCINL